MEAASGMAHALFIVFIFSATGFAGVSAVAALTKRFGALVAALTTTARKAVTIALSFLLFPKPFCAQHVAGAAVFLCAVVLKAREKGGGGGAPALRRPRKASFGALLGGDVGARDSARRTGADGGEPDIRSGEHAWISRQSSVLV